MANEFIYAQPVKIWFGEGKFAQLSAILEELRIERAVLVCGRHFAPDAQAMMASDKRFVALFSQVEQNPQLSGIEETVHLCRAHDAQAVIGIGGGSSMDTAKFAAAVAPNEGEALDYYEGRRSFDAKSRLAILAVPTTAGTGSEVTQVSVVSHGKEKKTINNPAFMPTAAIVDPLLSIGVPPRTTMCTGLDAMAHALEGYWSKNHQPIPDLTAIQAVRLILENLEKAYRHGDDREARGNMALAALMGGLSFALPKTAASHACSYPLSEDYHLPHGEACAFTLDSLVKINADERLEYLCRAVGLSGTDELAARIRAFKEMAGLRTKLGDLGEVDMDKLCRDCAAHPLMNNNPVKLDEKALRDMFEALK
ncbi:MAG: iron-containing alcohol dehydrogenase [Oscillospiraceae bacterium]|nr:iron-containing alcohol dehydrogenase [Oscillospiraceae bacterium]